MTRFDFPLKFIPYLLALTVFLIFGELSFAQDCADVVIPALPYEVASTTCGEGNDVNNNACNSWMMSGEDIIYSYSTTSESCLFIELSGYQAGAAGLIVTDGCPGILNSNCVIEVAGAWGATSMSATISTQPNTTYYFTVSSDSWSANCIDFTFSVSSDCPDPTSNDCLGAVNMCDGYYYEENAPTGNGNYTDNLPTNACLMTTVDNMGWYSLTTQTAGLLNFTLTPNSTDDYDWMLFNLTDASCADIATSPDLMVSCNTYGLIGSNGQTGISSANGGTGSANGPGDLNGPAFNADIMVEVGETYVLMISNWSATTNGYELDFGASTATFVDEIPPEVESVTYSCDGTVTVEFSEYIDCNTALPEYFTVEGVGGPYTVANMESPCAGGSIRSLGFVLDFNTPFPQEGGTFNFVFEADEIADMCGNFLEPISIPFVISPGLEVVVNSEPAACGNSNGSLSVTVNGGNGTLQYSINNGPFQDSNVFNNLLPGEYTVTVEDAAGCIGTATGEVWEEVIAFTAGQNSFTCNNSFYTNASLPNGYTGIWSGPPGLAFQNPTDVQALVTAATAGEYELVWTISNNINCTTSQNVTVSFSKLGVGGMAFEPISCFGACDGSYTVIPSGMANADELNYTWSSGTPDPIAPETATGLCGGLHNLTIHTDSGCVFEVPVFLPEPEKINFNEVILTPESCPGFNDASIQIISNNAVSYSFDGGESFGNSSVSESLGAGTQHIFVQGSTGCRRDTVVQLPPSTGPKSVFIAEIQNASIYDPIFQFKNNSRDYATSYWQFGYPERLGSSALDEPRFTFNSVDTGTYVVMLVVTDYAGCVDTSFQSVTVYEDVLNFIPNAFSPNEDGINDIFKPVLRYVDQTDYRMQIFDRWGKMVFETYDPKVGWNGSLNGNAYYLEAGIYLYSIRIKSERTQEVEEIKGSVTLIR